LVDPQLPDIEVSLPARSPRPEDQLREAFDAFRSALQLMLQDEARASVESAVDRLASQNDEFTVADVQVEVTVVGLTLQSRDAGRASSARQKRSARRQSPQKAPRRATRRGARGGVRQAILDAFGLEKDAELTISDVSAAVQSQGVTTTTNNLHQQLRRLVQAGELARAGRGRYRRVLSPSP
jgi:hypothetical protein